MLNVKPYSTQVVDTNAPSYQSNAPQDVLHTAESVKK